ncbi:uncharacterized protein LOC112568374 [Pomacea canaliculata]|uniref:uncharacterized protein LOC112568374 n=1 Tax=Pomacea canaliculata TaxID=400727 RepID=UPI000D73649B|nr:uncharacterized protein LOC112568374 [Pomacea canaliculata]
MKLSTTFVLSFTFIITALVYSSNGEKKEKTCADVKLAEPVNETVEANNDGYVHVSFMLNTDNCQDSPDGLRLKISTCEERLPCSFCTIVVNGILCNVTDRSHTCQCLIYQQQMFVSLYKNISRSDKEIRLTVRLKDLTEETLTLVNISFVNATDASSVNRTGPSAEKIPTLMTSMIIGSCGGVVVAVVFIIVVIIKRICGGQNVDVIDLHFRQEEPFWYYTTSENSSVNTEIPSNVMPCRQVVRPLRQIERQRL